MPGKKTKTILIPRTELRVSEPKEIALVQVAVRDALKKGGLFLRPRGGRRGTVEWIISESQAPPTNEDEGFVSFMTVAEWIYWLGMQLKFELIQGEPRFLGASLIVLRNALATDERTKVLRAEWERREEPEHRKHAQPHWHVYASELEQGDLGRFHLAMAACWHLGESESHYHEPSPEGVASWMGGCVKYIRSQLEAIGRRPAK
jgi:hypothetical protein